MRQLSLRKKEIMGTRHLVAVVLNKEVKVAQYGQWDGYLDGQGRTVVDFISKKMDLRKFKKAVSECKFLTPKEIKDTWTECGANPNSDMVGFDIADKHSAKYPGLSRDTGAGVLALIQSGKVRGLDNAITFASDSLFCEYAYVLDLDNKVLEIYKGFNKGKAKGRFAKMAIHKNHDGSTSEYNPITLLKKIKFEDCGLKVLKALDKKEQEQDA